MTPLRRSGCLPTTCCWGASFPNEPPLTDEADYGVIQAYYANLKEKGQPVSATLFLAHLENKVPVSHQCDFVELHDRYQDRDSPYVIDWDVYDDCVKSILRNVPTPTIIQFLRTKKKKLGAAKPKQIKLLVASVTSYQKLYPDESIGWKAVFRFFFNEFRATSLVAFQMKQFRCIHKYLTEDTPLPNREELWKEFSVGIWHSAWICT